MLIHPLPQHDDLRQQPEDQLNRRLPTRPSDPFGIRNMHERKIPCIAQESSQSPRPHLNAYAGIVLLPNFSNVTAVACPSATQCTVTASAAPAVVTFNPQTGKRFPVRLALGLNDLSTLACPTTRMCTALSGNGAKAVTFDPHTGKRVGAGIERIARREPLTFALACPSTRQCTEVQNGSETTFDPTTRRAVGHT